MGLRKRESPTQGGVETSYILKLGPLLASLLSLIYAFMFFVMQWSLTLNGFTSHVSDRHYRGTAVASKFTTSATPCSIGINEGIDESHFKSQSAEDRMLLTWFSKLCHGTYIELGALDGVKFSNSYVFHKSMDWKGVLIELVKSNYDGLVRNRPNEIATIHAGVCKEPQSLHYFKEDHEMGAVGGIYEFASPSFRDMWWGKISLDDERVGTINCEPLGDLLFKYAPNVTYFDFFSLDVEGAELAVLESVDFERVGFGIILTEADEHNQRKNLAIKTFLGKKGYEFLLDEGRSYWFVNRDFDEIYDGVIYE